MSGQAYQLSYYWNEQNGFWTLSLSQDIESIIDGWTINANSIVSFAWGYKVQQTNELWGAIYCLNTDESNAPLDRYSFGKKALLVYYTAAELKELSTGAL